jgi:hypothetical protein
VSVQSGRTLFDAFALCLCNAATLIVSNSDLANLKPNWLPKADIPSAVPKLPQEYIHRHRLMKQVVNCLLDKNGVGPRDVDDEVMVSILLF